MNIYEMRTLLCATQKEFAKRYNIPLRTIRNWEAGVCKPPKYVMELLEHQVQFDCMNRRTIKLPQYSQHKKELPKRSDYIGADSWLKAVNECMGEKFIFALDEALMCQGYFLGRNQEFLIWGYGDNSLSRFNGVVLLGNNISQYCVKEKDGLLFTDFNRTLTDALANQSILDMQGITEALSNYYYMNEESFRGVSVAPEYQFEFEKLADDAIKYYTNSL